MKIPAVALTALLAAKSADAFAPPTTFANVRTFTKSYDVSSNKNNPAPMTITTECNMVSGGFLGDEIKPGFDDEDAPIDDNVQQPLSASQRKDNLNEIRNLQNVEIEDAKRYSNYEGFVNGRKKLKERKAKDPWFRINDALRKAVVMGNDAETERLKKLWAQVREILHFWILRIIFKLFVFFKTRVFILQTIPVWIFTAICNVQQLNCFPVHFNLN